LITKPVTFDVAPYFSEKRPLLRKTG